MSACIEAAIAAPSIHNSQPWLFRARGARVDVLVDRRRQLAVADPDGREMHVSVGAALFNLRTSMLAHGRQPLVELLPHQDQPDLVASVVVGPEVTVTADVRTLADAIGRRQTNRRPFWTMPVPAEILADLVAAAREEGGILDVVDPVERGRVLDAVRSAEKRLRSDPRYRVEVADWVSATPERDHGVPTAALGPRPQLADLPVRDFDLDHTVARRVAPFEPEPTIAVLYTSDDTVRGWLQAGQALERTLLTAESHRVAVAPMTQVIAVPELRGLLGRPDRTRFAQSVLRLGYAGSGPRAPRRPLRDVLLT